MKFRVLDEALAEAHAAAAWYDEQDPGLGGEFLVELKSAWDAIRRSPQSQSILETVDLPPHELRRRLLSRFPYLVVFTLSLTEIIVVAVVHERRIPEVWINRLVD